MSAYLLLLAETTPVEALTRNIRTISLEYPSIRLKRKGERPRNPPKPPSYRPTNFEQTIEVIGMLRAVE
ncbi:hypothetical protein JMJ78_0008853 [Colletotrichum scovillei]|nr:hypothetical protein JMJ78_0008853 [Colletotrichum scovillei]